MKDKIYYTFKISLGVLLAIGIAQILGLRFPVSVAIITILSVQESRKKSLRISIKRFIAGNIALLISFLVFELFGFEIYGLVLILTIFIPIALWLKAKHSIISGFVLASHVLTFNQLSLSIYIEENLVLLIGIITGFLLMTHVPAIEKDLMGYQREIEEDMRRVLMDMSFNLRNICFLKDAIDLEILESKIKEAKALSYVHKDNHILDAKWNYVDYFQMRLIQLYRLMYMKDHFKGIFITQEQAIPLSDITEYISKIIGTEPDVTRLLEKINDLKHYYKKEPLPQSRLEFENRSVLFQYLSDLEEFLKIKQRYLNNKNRPNA